MAQNASSALSSKFVTIAILRAGSSTVETLLVRTGDLRRRMGALSTRVANPVSSVHAYTADLQAWVARGLTLATAGPADIVAWGQSLETAARRRWPSV
jgi:hypothetical protein